MSRLPAGGVLLVSLACADGGGDGEPVMTVVRDEPGSYSELAMSPDGSRLAFAHRVGGQEAVWTTAPDGSDPMRVTDYYRDADHFVWSPDGNQIAFNSIAGLPDVWLTDANSTGAIQS